MRIIIRKLRELCITLENFVYKEVQSVPREMTKYVRENLKPPYIGVEIGVLKGENSQNIIDNLQIKKLYLVDPWRVFKNFSGVIKDNRIYYEYVVKKFKKNDNVVILKKTSEGATKLIPNNLDFVYIDGNHKYEYVKKDIELYYPKIRNGGIIGGHDYGSKFKGVVQAVNEFVEKNGYDLHFLTDNWWIVKQE